MSLWEEVADIGEEFVEFLEKETGLSSAEVRRCPPSKRSQYAPEPTQLCGLCRCSSCRSQRCIWHATRSDMLRSLGILVSKTIAMLKLHHHIGCI